jgi:hypothetical protein
MSRMSLGLLSRIYDTFRIRLMLRAGLVVVVIHELRFHFVDTSQVSCHDHIACIMLPYPLRLEHPIMPCMQDAIKYETR